MPKRTYEIRVYRTFTDEEYVDLEIEADSPDQAEDMALQQARKDEAQLFGERHVFEPEFHTEFNGEDD